MHAATPAPCTAGTLRARRAAFCALLVATVAEGAEVSFLHPLTPERAGAYWDEVAAEVAAGRTLLLAAGAAGDLAGTVQLVPVASETAPRLALVAKLMVAAAHRRRGLAARLLAALEREALALGRDILLLDTVAGSPAHRLYLRLGWQPLGVIEAGAIDGHGRVCDNAMLTKRLGI